MAKATRGLPSKHSGEEMITAKDFDTIRGVYRIRRLLVSREQAAKSTYVIVESFGLTKQQFLDIVETEEQRRKEMLAQIRQLELEMTK
jgi:hypothetical protein